MKTRITKFAFLSLSIISLNVFSQSSSDSIVMTIGGKKITIEEFENVYHKNNGLKTNDGEKSIDKYVDLFVNFKLKVLDAEAAGLDTLQKFKQELAGYRRQLASSYLTDGKVNEKLIEETYERLKEEICVSHILVFCPEMATPKDSLLAFNKIWETYNLIKKNGSFEKYASNRQFNDDTTILAKSGFIGCFSALDLVYPFETAAYNTKTGEVSKPVRTKYGYHIIKVNERKKAHGEVLVSHIMLKSTANMSSSDSTNQQKKIKELYDKLVAGEDFEQVAKEYSDDRQTAANGGKLPWIGINKTPKEFEEVAFSLKNKGDYSMPVRTPYGIHIIKLLDKKTLGSFDEEKADIKQKLSRVSRFSAGRSALIESLKKEYAYTEKQKSLQVFYKLVDSSLFSGKWNPAKAKKKKNEMFVINNKKYSIADFADFINSTQKPSDIKDKKMLVDNYYHQFVDEMIIQYENSRLEEKYPTFRSLMREYRDGILLFDITNNNVWAKAVSDSAGLASFFEANKEKYTWGERADATFYKCANKEIAQTVKNLIENQKTDEEILAIVNKDSQLSLSIIKGPFAKGQNKLVDENWKEGVSGEISSDQDNKVVLINVRKILKDEPKKMSEVKGLVTSDYQTFLEQQWIKGLKEKYTVVINEEVLKLVK